MLGDEAEGFEGSDRVLDFRFAAGGVFELGLDALGAFLLRYTGEALRKSSN